MATTNGGVNGDPAAKCILKLGDDGSVESRKYYLARITVLQMLSDRGYDVPASELDRSLSDFRSAFGNYPDVGKLSFSVSYPGVPLKHILVIYMGTEEIRQKTIRLLAGQIHNTADLKGLILILQSKMNSFATKALKSFPFKVETFHITDLLVNITKHEAQPKHEILDDSAKEAVLNKYSLMDKQLPHMLVTDALAKYYGLEKGQVVKFTYSMEAAGPSETYRCVV